ncbi:MAG TPA: redoxin domain-containing protein [Tissierellaceae bacterium]
MSNIEIGSKINDFTLRNQNGDDISLSDYRGKKVLLSFHPLAWTSVCTDQMRALERNYDKFEENNVVVLGLSVDPEPSKKAWASVLSLEKLNILSDFKPLAKVAKDLDIYNEKLNASERANFLIDEDGNLIWKKVYELSTLPDLDEIFEII